MKIIDYLDEEHRRIGVLTDELVEAARGARRSTSSVSPERAGHLGRQVVRALAVHEFVEECVFWPAVRIRLDDGLALEAKGLEQEAMGKELLNELSKTKAGTSEFEAASRSLASAIDEHVSFEQAQVWPKLMRVLGEEDQRRLGSEAEALAQTAPTRPHPHAPAKAAVLRAIGPVVAALDRARDSLEKATG